MRKLNVKHLQALISLINQGPYLQLLSMKLRELGPGYAKVTLELGKKHLNPFGGTHGGVFSSLIDTAAFWAVYCELEENAGLTTLDIKVDNLAPVKEGHLTVEGRRIRVGKRICLAEAVISDRQGKCLAHGTSKLMVIPGTQTIAQAVSSLGFATLPPKFICEDDLE